MRISDTFARLRKSGRTGLVTYVTAGDPNLSRSGDILRCLDASGADVIEVGVPFSDPLADGPVIQRATERALAGGMTLAKTLDLVARERSRVRAPMVLFTYANPIVRMGAAAFAARAAEAGVDGVLILDLPPEEAGDVHGLLGERGLDTIFLLSPTTTDARLRRTAAIASGFLYGISRLGVTGARETVASAARELGGRVRAITDLPLALGFGVSRPEHVREIGECADAAVVGSALVAMIADAGGADDVLARVERYIGWLKGERSAA